MMTLEELDNHKKGMSEVARNARTVSRSLDQLVANTSGVLGDGIPLNKLGNKEIKSDYKRILESYRGISSQVEEAVDEFSKDDEIAQNFSCMITPMSQVKQKKFNDENIDEQDILKNSTSSMKLHVQNIQQEHHNEEGKKEDTQER
jgi:predicted ribonuclease YlaK